MRSRTRSVIADRLGTEVLKVASVSGGCINEAWRCELSDGRTLFVKSNQSDLPRLFETEAAGLRWLAEAKALRVPQVIDHSDEAGESFLALEFIAPSSRSAHFDEALGRGLALLHAFGAPSFGLEHPNYLATLHQENSPATSWSDFYLERRLLPLVRLAVDTGRVARGWQGRFEPLFGKMPELCGPEEEPARLHGDLWSGNVHSDESGAPVLIDPAVYGGHREIDLAMLSLFGAPGPRFYDAYEEAYPLSPGHRERTSLYQLYPLLAHVNLFGGHYVRQTEAALSQYL